MNPRHQATTTALQSICHKWAHNTEPPTPHTIVQYIGNQDVNQQLRVIDFYPPPQSDEWKPILRVFPEGTVQDLEDTPTLP